MTELTHPVAHRRIEQYAALRILVAFLGEKDQFNWWDCLFLNATGRKFLAIDYPKSFLAAAANAATEAAGLPPFFGCHARRCAMPDCRIELVVTAAPARREMNL